MTDPLTVDSPAKVAAQVERARRWVDIATWVAIGLGLAFTAVNVQQFAAAGALLFSLGWCVAWLLDPMVSVLLLAVVRAEQVTARWQVPMPWPVTVTKWAAFAATYAMNTWSSWRDGIPSGVVLHSIPPVFVLLAAEVAPALRDRLTEAVAKAVAQAQRLADAAAAEVAGPVTTVIAADQPVQVVIPPDEDLPGQDRAPAPETVEVATPATDTAPGPGPGAPADPVGTATLTEPDTEPTGTPTIAADADAAQARDDDADVPDDDAEHGDPRVRLLAGLLAEQPDMTGKDAETALDDADMGTSYRTARRLLAEARRAITPVPDDSDDSAASDDEPARTGTDNLWQPAPLSLVPGPSSTPPAAGELP